MKVGDLVVRIWCNKPHWEMIGIIIDKTFKVRPSGGAEWRYAIKWSKKVFEHPGGDKFGQWSEREIEVINAIR